MDFPARRKGEIVRHWSIRGSEALEMGNAPFLEASRRNWKGGGAENGEKRGVGTEAYKGGQDASFVSLRGSFVSLCIGGFVFSVLVETGSVFVMVQSRALWSF